MSISHGHLRISQKQDGHGKSMRRGIYSTEIVFDGVMESCFVGLSKSFLVNNAVAQKQLYSRLHRSSE